MFILMPIFILLLGIILVSLALLIKNKRYNIYVLGVGIIGVLLGLFLQVSLLFPNVTGVGSFFGRLDQNNYEEKLETFVNAVGDRSVVREIKTRYPDAGVEMNADKTAVTYFLRNDRSYYVTVPLSEEKRENTSIYCIDRGDNDTELHKTIFFEASEEKVLGKLKEDSCPISK